MLRVEFDDDKKLFKLTKEKVIDSIFELAIKVEDSDLTVKLVNFAINNKFPKAHYSSERFFSIRVKCKTEEYQALQQTYQLIKLNPNEEECKLTDIFEDCKGSNGLSK